VTLAQVITRIVSINYCYCESGRYQELLYLKGYARQSHLPSMTH
jgi:hypothetical protein